MGSGCFAVSYLRGNYASVWLAARRTLAWHPHFGEAGWVLRVPLGWESPGAPPAQQITRCANQGPAALSLSHLVHVSFFIFTLITTTVAFLTLNCSRRRDAKRCFRVREESRSRLAAPGTAPVPPSPSLHRRRQPGTSWGGQPAGHGIARACKNTELLLGNCFGVFGRVLGDTRDS